MVLEQQCTANDCTKVLLDAKETSEIYFIYNLEVGIDHTWVRTWERLKADAGAGGGAVGVFGNHAEPARNSNGT